MYFRSVLRICTSMICVFNFVSVCGGYGLWFQLDSAIGQDLRRVPDYVHDATVPVDHFS